jgi:hypothetical protein
MKKAVPDSTLSKLWSRAVVAYYGSCPITGRSDFLHAHHIVGKGRQNRFSSRWDIRNGVPLSPEAHRAYHDGDLTVSKKLLEYVESRGDVEHLMRLKNMLKHEFLLSIGKTEDEYRLYLKKYLTSLIVESN